MKFVKMSDSDYDDLVQYLQQQQQQKLMSILIDGEMDSKITEYQLGRQETTKKKILDGIESLKRKGLKVTTQELHFETRLSRPAIDKYKEFWLPCVNGEFSFPNDDDDLETATAPTVPDSDSDSAIIPTETATAPTVPDSCKGKTNAERTAEAREKISNAIAELQKDGSPITKTAISRKSGVTVATISKHKDIFSIGGEQQTLTI